MVLLLLLLFLVGQWPAQGFGPKVVFGLSSRLTADGPCQSLPWWFPFHHHSSGGRLGAQGGHDDDDQANKPTAPEGHEEESSFSWSPPFPRKDDQLILPQAPQSPVTRVELDRFRIERALLEDLRTGDASIKKLRNFWFAEQGKTVEAWMYQAEASIGKPKDWDTAEAILLQVCQRSPTFVEPFVRLSKLYCLQGKFEDSRKLCEASLALKP